jgi:hypothetical protein
MIMLVLVYLRKGHKLDSVGHQLSSGGKRVRVTGGRWIGLSLKSLGHVASQPPVHWLRQRSPIGQPVFPLQFSSYLDILDINLRST